MKQPSEMGDYGINLEIYQRLGNLSKALPDYCNNIADIWPYVVEHSIQLHTAYPPNQKSTAYRGEGFQWFQAEYCVSNKNPIRALAECLLLILRDKGEKQ